MPEFSSEIQTKIDALREISKNFSEVIEVYQFVKIDWAEPDGAKYYASAQAAEIEADLPVSPVEIRIPAEDYPAYFLPVSADSSMGDEEIDLKLWDGDDEISRLVYENGEGIKVESFLWFPNVDLLLSEFWGHLRTSEDSEVEFWIGKAANGFRSPNLPMPRRAHYRKCQAIFGVLETGCDYDRHRGGSRGNLNSGVPFTSCPQNEFSDCTLRLDDKLSHLSHQSVTESIVNYQTKGNALLATSRGNETNLKRPVRVIMGTRTVRDLDLMAAIPLYNNKHPEQGFWRCKWEVGEGPMTFLGAKVNGQNCLAGNNLIHFVPRGGEFRQPPTSFTPGVHNYSYTCHFDYTYGWVNPDQTSADSLKGEATTTGLNDLKHFDEEGSIIYTGTSSNRAWQIVRMLTDKRWGYGLDLTRLAMPSFSECGIWGGNAVEFTEPTTGNVLQHIRSNSNVELNERTTQQQIEDMCWAGRFSRPFLFQGKLHIVPLRAYDYEELAAAPIFTDTGEDRNIIWEDNKTTLRYSQKSDEDLPNRIELIWYDENNENKEAPPIIVEDADQQIKAGIVMGDTTRRTVPKKESALGVTNYNQGIKLAYTLLDLGKFDEGGLKNNLKVTFKAWFLDCLSLHPEKPIKVISAKIERFGFEWFRIKKIKRLPNLQVEITAQAYPREYYDNLEYTLDSPGGGWSWGGFNEYIPLEFGDVAFKDGYLQVEIDEGVDE